jgi:hypothetical protein
MNQKVLSMIIVLLFFPTLANSASVYKCTKKDKTIIFSDKPCPVDTDAQILYTESEKEIKRRALEENIATIKRLINSNQITAAKEHAKKNNLVEIYRKLLEENLQEQAEQEQQKIEQEKQQQIILQQQTLNLQRQQLELQKQQIEIDKAELERQQTINNSVYYPYPVLTPPIQNCHRHHGSKNCLPPTPPFPPNRVSPLSSGGMNPPSSLPQMNPPISTGIMNPPPGVNPNISPGMLNPPPPAPKATNVPAFSGRVILPKK